MNIKKYIITDSAKLDTLISSIAGRGKKLDRDIHLAACSALIHAQKHNNLKHFNDLRSAMPKGSRVKGLEYWATKYSPIELKKGEYVLKKGRKAEDFKVETFIDEPFWKTSTEKNPAPMTIDRAIAAFKRNLSKIDGVDVESVLAAVSTAVKPVSTEPEDVSNLLKKQAA